MLDKARTALNRAVEEVVKEFDSSYEQTKRYNESLRNNNRLLMKRIKELKGRCDALQVERDKFAHEIEDLRVASQAALRAAELVKAHPEICSTFTVHLSEESKKIAELNKEVADLQKKNSELSEQLKSKQILDSVFAQKYWAQQNALQSCERGEACEVELDDGAPFLEKGYFLRLTKKEYGLMKDDRLIPHIAFEKRSDK